MILATLALAAACSGGNIALTFDDGPGPQTVQVLRELKAAGLHATFFLIGANVKLYPDVARAIVADGHAIGNHSMTHPDLASLTPNQVEKELADSQQAIKDVTGVTPTLFRPPYSSTTQAIRAAAAAHGLTEVIWSVDSYDWAGAEIDTILNRLTLVQPGGIYEMHENEPPTLWSIFYIGWYFNTYWASAPICGGRIAPTTEVMPVDQWFGFFFHAKAVQW